MADPLNARRERGRRQPYVKDEASGSDSPIRKSNMVVDDEVQPSGKQLEEQARKQRNDATHGLHSKEGHALKRYWQWAAADEQKSRSQQRRPDSEKPPAPTRKESVPPLNCGGPPRLINVHTMYIERFSGEVPEYAILSHTWGSDELLISDFEPTVQQPAALSLRQGMELVAGYGKLRGACQQANKDGIDHIWIDSCCIDKASSAELSEAINSMYAWYRIAKVCYVFLEDLPRERCSFHRRQDDQSMWGLPVMSKLMRASLQTCRWFTRGWTLQELLASPNLRFFASRWYPIGSLEGDLLDAVAEITRIDPKVLQHEKPLVSCSIAQRLSWASSRKTTKVEDEAYSLLGILDVHMASYYGEGRQAFQRLQEELLKKGDDLSILAWDPSDRGRQNFLLAASPADFADCGDVVLDDDSMLDWHETWLTSLGLKGQFEVMTRRSAIRGAPERLLLSLGCHKLRHPGKRIALPLANGSNSPREEPSSSLFFVSSLFGDTRTSSFGSVDYHSDLRTKKELTILKHGVDMKKLERTSLPHHFPNSTKGSTPNMHSRPTKVSSPTLYIDQNKDLPLREYAQGDEVEMWATETGDCAQIAFYVSKCKLHNGTWSYQLERSDGTIHDDGAWFPESSLFPVEEQSPLPASPS